ncbi:MAG: YceI family protein [Flavobacteriaceae bacterium]
MIRIKFVLISLFFLTLCIDTQAQNFNLNKTQSKLIVKGTSSLHDWYIEATDMSGEINFDLDSVLHIKKLTFEVRVAGLKGDKKGMLKKMRNTLQANKFGTIRYQFKKAAKIIRLNNREFSLQTTGNLTIAGVSRQIALKFFLTFRDGSVTVVGDKKFKMSDYNIKPPKALFGMLKTADDIKVNFYVLYQ